MTNDYYHIKIKKEYANDVLKDLAKMKAIEITEQEIPKWQQEESNKRLKEMIAHPENNIAWKDVKKTISKRKNYA